MLEEITFMKNRHFKELIESIKIHRIDCNVIHSNHNCGIIIEYLHFNNKRNY